MKRLSLAILLGFFVFGCDEGGLQSQRPKAEEIEPCDCVPPPTKTLPEEKLNAAVERLTGYAELIDVLTPDARELDTQPDNEGFQIIAENCLLVHKKRPGEKANEVLDYIETENRSETNCPVRYRTETRVKLNPRKLTVKGRYKTNFRSESVELSEMIGLSNLVLNGPYFRKKKVVEGDDRKLEVLLTEFSQKGFAVFPDMGRVDMKIIQQDSKEIYTDEAGYKSFGDILVNRFVVWEIDEEIIVFQSKFFSGEKSPEPVTECRINGTDVSDTRLCQIY